MSVSAPHADPTTRQGVRAVATAMLPELPALGAGTAQRIAEEVPETAAPQFAGLVLGSCESNSTALLDALVRGVPLSAMTPSTEVMQTTRELVQRGLTFPLIMRAYRIGIAYWCERWADAVRRHGCGDAEAIGVVSAGTTFLLGWLELVTERLSDEYRAEAERLARAGSIARVAAVRRALEEPDLDVAAASLGLGYDLGGRHLALVLHQHEEDAADGLLDAAARTLAATLSEAQPLVVRVDVATTWCWVALGERRVGRLPAPPGHVIAGHGRAWSGLEGFRRSYREAVEAVRVAQLAGRGPGTVTSYGQSELAAICSGDAERCRTFVLDELGPLAADDDATRRLRATLEAFFAEHSNFRATGKRLGIHHNTVRYRMERIERLLGRSPDERRLSLELALHLAARLSPWVTTGAAQSSSSSRG